VYENQLGPLSAQKTVDIKCLPNFIYVLYQLHITYKVVFRAKDTAPWVSRCYTLILKTSSEAETIRLPLVKNIFNIPLNYNI